MSFANTSSLAGRRFAGVVLFVMAVTECCFGTMVWPVLMTCPICRTEFVDYEVGSFTYCGSFERDLSDDPMFRFGRVRTCPHCLYSSLTDDFESINADERSRIVHVLAMMDVDLAGDLAGVGSSYLTRHELERIVCGAIAKRCYAERAVDHRRLVRLAAVDYFASKYSKSGLVRAERIDRVIRAITAALEQGVYEGGELAVYTYMRAELLRLSGKFDDAVAGFHAARGIVDGLKVSSERAEYVWLSVWADEQLALATRRDGSESCSIEDEDRLRMGEAMVGARAIDLELLRRQLRESLLKSPLTEFRPEEGVSLTCIADSMGMDVRRLARLNPDIWNSRISLGGQAVVVPNFPDGWTEQQLLRGLAGLMSFGDARAAEYFVEWVTSSASEGAYSSRIRPCWESLAQNTMLLEASTVNACAGQDVHQATMRDCVAYICNQPGGRERMLDHLHLEDDSGRTRTTILDLLAIKRDTCVKEKILSYCLNSSERRYPGWDGCEYLAVVCEKGDLTALRKIASSSMLGSREHVEDVIRSVNIRASVELDRRRSRIGER